MRIEQLQAFLAVVKTKSFGLAAKECGVTQSTVSRQIQALESQLGLPLFHRQSQSKLTVAGETFLTRAQRIVREWDLAQTEIQELGEGKQPELCVAAIHSVCAYHLPPILQKFCQNYPQTQLRVTALGSDRALKVLRDGLVDVAIVMDNRFLTMSPEMVVYPLYQETAEVLMAADHPLSGASAVSWEDLGQYPQIIFKDGYGMQRLVNEGFNRHDLQPHIALELNTIDAFRGIVRLGQMVAVLPQSALMEVGKDPGLVSRPLAEIASGSGKEAMGWHRDVVLVTTSDRLALPPVKHFCRLVQELMTPVFAPTPAGSLSKP